MNLRRWIITPLLVSLFGLLAACIIELQPDNSMIIYIPPPVFGTLDTPPLSSASGTIPDLALATVMTRVPITTTGTITGSATITGTVPLTSTLTLTTTIIVTRPISGTMTAQPTSATRATTVRSTTVSAATVPSTATTKTATTKMPVPKGTPTRATTPAPPRQGTATVRATATKRATTARTPTPARKATATATRRLTATSATPRPTSTQIPDTVFLGRHQGFADGGNYFVVGQVLNGDAFPVFNVKVIGSFYDSSNNLVAAQEVTTDFAQIEPELSSPFKLQVSNGAGSIDRYELTLLWDDISVVDYEELAIESAELREDAGQLVGELRNEGSVSVQNIVVVATLYSAEGDVVDVILSSVNNAILAPGETSAYMIPLPADLDFERFEVQAQGALKLF